MRPNILVVDNEPINVRIFSAMLEAEGYRPVGVFSGEECLRRTGEEQPDVILLDAMMPGMDGFEVARRLRQNPETSFVPIVMVTALSDVKDRIRALDAGVDDFLTKPVDKAELLARVKASVKVKAYHEEIRKQQREKDELLNKTLKGTIRILVEILASINPAGFSQCSRLVPLTRRMAQYLMEADAWQAELVVMLSPIVEITIPKALAYKMRRAESLDEDEEKTYLYRTRQGVKLLADIPHLESIARALSYRNKNFDGSGIPRDALNGTDIPMAARISRVVFDYDRLLQQHPEEDIVALMHQAEGVYDVNVLAVLRDVRRIDVPDSFFHELRIEDLVPGMILGADVVDVRGRMIVGKGTELTPLMKLRLQHLAGTGAIGNLVRAYDGAHIGKVAEKKTGKS